MTWPLPARSLAGDLIQELRDALNEVQAPRAIPGFGITHAVPAPTLRGLSHI